MGDVPFFMLPTYGNKTYLRGHIEGSGRNKFMWMIQQEIRYPIPAHKAFWKRFVLNTSFATGRTSNSAKGFFSLAENAWSVSMGGRFRLFKENNLSLRLDFGISKGTNGSYAVFNEAF
jgi:hemolysin activation/secretion protein